MELSLASQRPDDLEDAMATDTRNAASPERDDSPEGNSDDMSDPTTSLGPAAAPQVGPARIDLYWLPLGAGGVGYVRLNGRIYEAFKARAEQRPPLDLYHTALEVSLPEGRFTVENAWPSPNADTASRGVVLEGPVFIRRLARFRPFRYEVRCWRDGVIADADQAAAVQLLSHDATRARHLLDLVAAVPSMIWGRDELETGEMWNSNSVISYLLARSGVPVESIHPPTGGHAPGWSAGVALSDSTPVKR